jgi:hypothetical protein
MATSPLAEALTSPKILISIVPMSFLKQQGYYTASAPNRCFACAIVASTGKRHFESGQKSKGLWPMSCLKRPVLLPAGLYAAKGDRYSVSPTKFLNDLFYDFRFGIPWAPDWQRLKAEMIE